MNDGYIKLYRKFVTWEWYDDINTSRLFLHLLLTANWKDTSWHGITIKRGQKMTSYRKLSSETKLSIQSVRTALTRLKSTQEVTVLATNQYIIINIEKYEDYQSIERVSSTEDSTESNMLATQSQHADNMQSTLFKEYKELKEDKNSLSLKEYKQINNQELPPDLFELFENEFKRPLTQIELQRLSDWSREYDQQLIVYSLREASINNAYSFNYIDKILCEWQRKGMTAEKYEEREIYADA